MDILFTAHGWEDFQFWLDNDIEIASKINDLIRDIRKNPFQGLGKPEGLKHQLQGYWSRRITGEHRLVYKIDGKKGKDQKCSIIQCRFHYDD
jgi:toxin YoeB